MSTSSGSGAGFSDPDDAPELTEEMMARADVYRGGQLVRRGRPASLSPKQLISLRLDADVIARYRATGEGWQTRINETLRQAVSAMGRKR